MRRIRALAGGVVLVAVTAIGIVVAMSSARPAIPAAAEPSADTVGVEKGELSAVASVGGILSYRARSDGSPYSVFDRVRGTYTELPEAGDTVDCGDVLYRVDERPVVLLCGAVPAYRALQAGARGADVRQLNRNLHTLGYDAGIDVDPDDDAFGAKTEMALDVLQRSKGLGETGALGVGDAVFLPGPLRIAMVTAELGGSAQPGAKVALATSDTPEVRVNLDPSQQGEVRVGEPVRITLPTGTAVPGKVDRLGKVAQVAAGETGNQGYATIPAFIGLDDPDAARGLDGAPVQAGITTQVVQNVLSVPVVALVGMSGGGFAVEVVRADGRRELVAVTLGLFDGADGRVEVDGDLAEGDRVVVPTP
jgi:peptidoglycan hydrolase-like protein with peptidoglycan-binding domain